MLIFPAYIFFCHINNAFPYNLTLFSVDILQVECHPYLNQSKLLDFCKSHEIVLVAYAALVLGASMRHSAQGKGHEEGGWTYAKAGSSLRSLPGNPQASTPITRACLLHYFVLSPTPLTLRGAVPHHLFRRRS